MPQPEKEKAPEAGGPERTERSQSGSIIAREEIRSYAQRVVDDAATDSIGPGAGSFAGRVAPSAQSSRSERPSQVGAGRPGDGECHRGSAPTLEAEAAAALAVVSPAMAPALLPSAEACPLCSAPYLRRNPDAIGEPWAVACDNCAKDWVSLDELLREVAARDRAAWRSLSGFERWILSEPETEAALRRIVRPLIELRADPDVILEIAFAVNGRRSRPAPDSRVEDLAVEIATEIGEQRKRAQR